MVRDVVAGTHEAQYPALRFGNAFDFVCAAVDPVVLAHDFAVLVIGEPRHGATSLHRGRSSDASTYLLTTALTFSLSRNRLSVVVRAVRTRGGSDGRKTQEPGHLV